MHVAIYTYMGVYITSLQKETRQIRARIQNELAGGCLQISSSPNSSVTVKSQQKCVRVSPSHESDSDFEDQPKMIRKRKISLCDKDCSHEEQNDPEDLSKILHHLCTCLGSNFGLTCSQFCPLMSSTPMLFKIT